MPDDAARRNEPETPDEAAAGRMSSKRPETPDDVYRRVCEGDHLRSSLIELRSGMKDESYKRRLAYLMQGDFRVFTSLLSHEDPKVRRNAALILGAMETEDVLPFLFDAYEKEETLFIRADYLKAMDSLDLGPWVKRLRRARQRLEQMNPTQEEQKHVHEEQVWLEKLISRYEKQPSHVFAMAGDPQSTPDVILVTGTLLREVTAGKIGQGEVTYLHSGIRVHQGSLSEMMKIRTFTQMLFPFECGRLYANDPAKTGETLSRSGLLELVDRFYLPAPGTEAGKEAGRDRISSRKDRYFYRLDVRGMEPDGRGSFIRKCAASLDALSRGRLLNDPSGYELEIRLLVRRDGTLQPLLRLPLLPDKRFSYRREFLPDSLTPVHAALAMEVAGPYLRENAQIIDPFCGVGTMLIERKYALGSADAYGIDIREQAISKARGNTAVTGMLIHYINRDIFSFRHGHPFDEVITQPPSWPADPLKEKDLYRRFLQYMPQLLRPEAVLLICVTNPGALQEITAKDHRYQVLTQAQIHSGNGLTAVVLQYRPQG